jgi:hypothetical protein
MQVIAKRTLMFIEHGVRSPKKVVVNAAPGPQEVPDWVADLFSFQHAVKEKVIVRVKIVEESEAPARRRRVA